MATKLIAVVLFLWSVSTIIGWVACSAIAVAAKSAKPPVTNNASLVLARLRAIRWQRVTLSVCYAFYDACRLINEFASKLGDICAPAKKGCSILATGAPPAANEFNCSHGRSALKTALNNIRHDCAPAVPRDIPGIHHLFRPPTSQGLVAFAFSLS